jgi:DnaJ-domain-containing protein 1
MPSRPAVRAVLCLLALAGGVALSFVYPEAAVHLQWGGFTLAVALFLLEPPTITLRLGREAEARASQQLAAAAQLEEKAHVLDLKDHALRERERRVRERESLLEARAAAILSRENDLQAAWLRLRGEKARGAPDPRAGSVVLSPEDWLGVPPGASQEEVRQAWVALAKAYHPDRLSGLPPWARDDGERRMKAINEAYEMLGG